ncbi:uncharacterized protein LOC124795585 [Schistocerca piceifrons]|uniref:uncharacterized protein LOC124795585 n=1 Tax=Schistocerca piceifrons TaxID=274613 RepID=UPI001F5FD4A4|nr:uncharacterized protein LOC124795585 [Schistocerca piceifrons]
MAKVTPLYKKGDKHEAANYRHVKLTAFLNKENISDVQHRFRTGRSTQSAIYSFLNEILTAVDNKQHVSGTFLDLSKAFDVIDHNTLLQKLGNYGIQGLPNKTSKIIKNNEKTVTVNFHTSQKLHPARLICKIDGKTVSCVSDTKFSGIHIQQNLKWETHFNHVNKKLNTLTYAVRILSQNTDLASVITM